MPVAFAQVAPRLCVGGAAVARDRQMLREAGVTHVVNCVGMLPPAAPFADELQYLVLHLLGALCRGVSWAVAMFHADASSLMLKPFSC